MKTFKARDIVRIYDDPLTERFFEGTARLLTLVRPDVGDGLEIWLVQFEGERGVTTRAVYKGTLDN